MSGTGTIPHRPTDWHAINWRKVFRSVRHLHLRIAEAMQRRNGMTGSREGALKGLSRMTGNGAPRDAVLNPCRRQERFGGTPLGHPIDPKAKARGEKSMSEKQGTSEDA